jgi:hypothetical protein
MFKEFFIEDNGDTVGTLTGHFDVTLDSEIFSNFFIDKNKLTTDQIEKLKSHINGNHVNIILDFEVDSDNFKSSALGSELLEKTLDFSTNPYIIIANPNNIPFLEDWYSIYDFETVDHINNVPIMVKK